MASPVQLAAFIRFQLEQLSARNAHHEFEHLCRHLTRARICSNILPATGPVSSGGDQGRDFETFRTYLRDTLPDSTPFVGLLSQGPVAFACTLTQRDAIGGKIRDDVTAIVSSGQPVEAIHYFCTSEVPVSLRHTLQTGTREKHSTHLEIHDGQAIAELLSDSDVLWIAEQYLHVPAELFHPTLTRGLSGFPTDYGPRIRDFLDEYLGSDTHPVPFGGRGTELAALDGWLADPTAPPYALLVAEAGRGKSALLARWTSWLIAQGEVEVVFIPVSVRFNTAPASVFFTALAARLGEVYHDPVQWSPLSAEEWRGVCQSYLHRSPPTEKPIVVILDGLDEAVGWQAHADLLPHHPTGLRVVVSARYLAGDNNTEGWRRRLGWEAAGRAWTLPLPLLDRSGLNEVLQAMGDPLNEVTSRGDVIDELYRLSEGDPLLIRLYVEALLPYGDQVAFLTPAALPSIQPGLSGYFERWREEQRTLWGNDLPLRERAVDTVLTLLAGALGPLDRAELLRLAPTEAVLTTWTLEASLTPLNRFIVGDGNQRGYVFSHPRLAQYFWERLTPAEQATWERRFLDRGLEVLAALNERSLAPQDASPYIVHHYGEHLDRAGVPLEGVSGLVSEGWMRAWEALESTYEGFLTDVDRVWQQADRRFLASAEHRGQALAQQIRCALLSASIGALATNLPDALYLQALQVGLLSPHQLLAVVRQIADEDRLTEVIQGLASHLPADFLEAARAIARKVHEPYFRGLALLSLLPDLGTPERPALLNEIQAIAKTVREEHWQAKLLGLALDAEGKVSAPPAPQGARFVPEGSTTQRPGVVTPMKPRKLRTALADARAITDSKARAASLIALLPHLDGRAQEDILDEAVTAARAIPPGWNRAYILNDLALYASGEKKKRLVTEAWQSGSRIRDERNQVSLLTALLPYLDEPHRGYVCAAALATARQIQDDGWRRDGLIAMLPHLVEPTLTEVLEEVLVLIRAMPVRHRRVNELSKVIPYAQQQRAALIREALAVAQSIEEDEARTQALRKVWPVLSKEQMEELASTIFSSPTGAAWLRLNLWLALASRLEEEAKRDALGKAVRQARAVEDPETSAALLCDVLPALEDGRAAIIEEVRAKASILQSQARTRVLLELVEALRDDERPDILPEVVGAIRTAYPELLELIWLARLVPCLPTPQRSTLLQEIIQRTPLLDQHTGHTSILRVLIPHLSAWVVNDSNQATSAWCQLLRALARHPRPVFLDDLAAIMPFAFTLVGHEAAASAEAITHTLQEVCLWWP